MFGVLPPPAGCIEAGGQAISRTKYADLFRAYGTTYGVGDNSTTFNVPDMRGRVPAGPNSMGGDTESRLSFGGSVGNTGGSEAVVLTASEVPGLSTIGGNPAEGQGSLGNGEYEGEPQAHSNVQPSIIVPFVIYTGVFE